MEINVIFNLLDKSANTFSRINNSFNQLSQKINKTDKYLKKFNQTKELFEKMGTAVTQITTPYIEFEQSMADLSAITGIVGSELSTLGKTAREIGVSSGLGATGAVNAFKLLASQIDVSKIGINGLIELQNKTITLAQASGMSLTDAANSMASTINQFGLGADEASRIINVLAAGSKYGAANIPELAMSFKVVGAAANAAGLSVEQTAGALEVLSKNNLKGAEAGTALRNIMLKMQTSLGVDFRKTSLTEALEKLRPKLHDATYLSGLFGMENMAAAQFLITNANAVKEMTDKVTNTSVATKQAAISTDTWSHRLKTQTARINDTFMTISESSKGILNLLQVGSNLSNIFLSFSPILSAVGGGFKTIGAGVSGISNIFKATQALNAAMSAGNIAKYAETVKSFGVAGRIASAGIWLKTAAVKAFTFASRMAIPSLISMVAQTWAWSAALLANPVTWVVVGITALVAAIVVCWQKFAEFRSGLLTAWDILKGFGFAIFEGITAPFKIAIETIGGVVKALKALMSGDFNGAWNAIKESFTKNVDIALKPYQTIFNTITSTKDNYNKHLSDEKAKEKTPKEDSPKAANPLSFPTPLFQPLTPNYTNDNNQKNQKSPQFGFPTIPLFNPKPEQDATQPPFKVKSYTDRQPNTASLITQNSIIDTKKINNPTTTFDSKNNRNTLSVNIDYSPQINISADMTQKSKDDLITTLRTHASELTRIVKEELRKENRTTYNYGIS